MRHPRIRPLVIACAVALVAGTAPPDAPAPVAAGVTDACDAGWANTSLIPQLHVQDVEPGGATGSLAVGWTFDGQDRVPMDLAWDGTTWSVRPVPGLARDAALQAIAGTDDAWSVGYERGRWTSRAVGLRLTPDGWIVDQPPDIAGSGEVLTDVAVGPDGTAWAVGFRATTKPVRRPIIWRHDGTGWQRQTLPRLGSGAFTAVVALEDGSVLAGGNRVGVGGVTPLLVRWDGVAWRRITLPPLGSDATIAALAARSATDALAVGWQSPDGLPQPLVLEGSGETWDVAPAPDPGGRFSMLLGASVDDEGRRWVVGTSYRDAQDRYIPVVAARDHGPWTIWLRPADTGHWFRRVSGDPLSDGWAAGVQGGAALMTQLCTPSGPARQDRRDRVRDSRERRFGPAGRTLEDEERGPRPRRGLPPAPPLGRATRSVAVVARDVTAEVGLQADLRSYGASVADLDGDGRDDLFISDHLDRPSLYLRRADGYELQERSSFPLVDRHGCAVGPIDPGPLPDVLCLTGGGKGAGIKANELWLDPGTGAREDRAASARLADPLSRGRRVVLLDVDGDGDLDAYLGNTGIRVDGHPSPNRLMRNEGDGTFVFDPGSGLTDDRGAWCARAADIDRDGDDDLLLCGRSGNVIPTSGLSIRRNDDGRFVDVTAAWGVQPIGETDALAVQLGGTRRPDLVQLSKNRLRVSLWRPRGFVTVFEATVDGGQMVEAGDVDGDGDLDLYLQLGRGGRNPEDVVLLNDGTGRGWTPMAIPSTTEGSAESVVALDHDGNGLMDFLVLNGGSRPGPRQLIAFYPATPD